MYTSILGQSNTFLVDLHNVYVFKDIYPLFRMSTSSYDFRRKRNFRIIVGSLWVLVCVIVGLSLAYWFTRTKPLEEINQNHPSLGGPYKRAAVASDAGPCSHVGTDILRRNGSAVDSAIATILCVGVINMHSTGIGGGGFMLVYNRRKALAEVFDFRETAPAKAKEDMFKNASFKEINSKCAQLFSWGKTSIPLAFFTDFILAAGESFGSHCYYLSEGRLSRVYPRVLFLKKKMSNHPQL